MKRKDSFWIPYADLMTVLMVIFLFISFAYMGVTQYQKKQQEKVFKEYKKTKGEIYNDLETAFKGDFEKWDMEVGKNLIVRFNKPKVLFHTGKSDITPKFKMILMQFFPKYLNIVLQKKYQDKIAEIRIEGHTDDVPIHRTNDPYIDNLKLSQDRSRKVLRFLRHLSYYEDLTAPEKEQLKFWLTADGFSFGRTVDSSGDYTFYTENNIDRDKSRRVEFRIVTTSELLVEKIIKQMKD